MFQFFRGWRKKVGSLLLVIALVFLGGWFRNCLYQDSLEYCPGKSMYCVSTGYGYVALLRFDFPDRTVALAASSVSTSPLRSLHLGWVSTRITEEIDEIRPWAGSPVKSHWQWHDFQAGRANFTSPWRYQKSYVIVPFWSLVLPFTFGALYLLTWKIGLPQSRPATPREHHIQPVATRE